MTAWHGSVAWNEKHLRERAVYAALMMLYKKLIEPA